MLFMKICILKCKKHLIHLVSFIRDGLKFCLGPSLILLGNLHRLVPYSSLIFLEHFDRLSLNISFWHDVCVQQITRGCQFLTWSMNETKWRKQSVLNQTLSLNFSNFSLVSYKLSLKFFGKPRPRLLFFSKIWLPSLIGRLLYRILSVSLKGDQVSYFLKIESKTCP